MTITPTNVYAMACHLRPDGTVPARVPSTDFRHLKRCIAAGLIAIDGSTLRISDAGIEALRNDPHIRCQAALASLERS